MVQLKLHQHSVKVILLSILVLAFVLRYSESLLKNGLSFGDGGRDIFVAKRMAENGVFLNIAPLSSSPLIPNTPIYYQTLALFYKIGGLDAVLMLFIVGGVSVVYCTYLIAKLLFNNQWLALWAAFFIAVSSLFINLSSSVFQPNLQFIFAVWAFYLTAKALSTHQVKFYLMSLIPLFFSIALHNGGIPVAAIISGFLVLSYSRYVIKKSSDLRLKGYYLLVIAIWFLWLFLTYYHKDINPIFFGENEGSFYLSPSVIKNKFTQFTDFLFYYLGEGHFPPWTQSFFIFFACLAVVRGLKKRLIPLNIGSLILILILTLVFMIIVPGQEFRSWHFYLQTFLLCLLIPMAPKIAFDKKKSSYFLPIWILIFSYVSIFANVSREKNFDQPLLESKIAANAIKTDIYI